MAKDPNRPYHFGRRRRTRGQGAVQASSLSRASAASDGRGAPADATAVARAGARGRRRRGHGCSGGADRCRAAPTTAGAAPTPRGRADHGGTGAARAGRHRTACSRSGPGARAGVIAVSPCSPSAERRREAAVEGRLRGPCVAGDLDVTSTSRCRVPSQLSKSATSAEIASDLGKVEAASSRLRQARQAEPPSDVEDLHKETCAIQRSARTSASAGAAETTTERIRRRRQQFSADSDNSARRPTVQPARLRAARPRRATRPPCLTARSATWPRVAHARAAPRPDVELYCLSRSPRTWPRYGGGYPFATSRGGRRAKAEIPTPEGRRPEHPGVTIDQAARDAATSRPPATTVEGDRRCQAQPALTNVWRVDSFERAERCTAAGPALRGRGERRCFLARQRRRSAACGAGAAPARLGTHASRAGCSALESLGIRHQPRDPLRGATGLEPTSTEGVRGEGMRRLHSRWATHWGTIPNFDLARESSRADRTNPLLTSAELSKRVLERHRAANRRRR